MAIVAYSNNYSNTYATGTLASYNAILTDNAQRHGEAIWIRALATIPVTAVATDTVILAPLVPGLRPVAGFVTASATNGSLTVSLGYESAPTAILSASTSFQSASQTALTPTQIAAVTVLTGKGTESGQDRLILTLGGTMSNATNVGVWLQMANFAA